MRYILLDSRIPESFISEFERRGYTPILLPPCDRLDRPVASHPDMLCAAVNGHLLIERQYHEERRSLFKGLSVELTEETFEKKYPRDILLNALNVNGTVYGHEKVSEKIKRSANRFVRIKQGYARCSTLLIGNAALTADTTIAKALTADGMDVMKITPGHIRLEGYDYGFIGGASAVVGNEVLFFGNIERHPDHAAIVAFITSHGYTPVSLSGDELYDYGGAVINEE